MVGIRGDAGHVVGDGGDILVQAGNGRDITLDVSGNPNGNPPTDGDNTEVQTKGATSNCSFSFSGRNSSVTPWDRVQRSARFSFRPCR